MNIDGTKYEVVKFVGKKKFNFKMTKDLNCDWDL